MGHRVAAEVNESASERHLIKRERSSILGTNFRALDDPLTGAHDTLYLGAQGSLQHKTIVKYTHYHDYCDCKKDRALD